MQGQGNSTQIEQGQEEEHMEQLHWKTDAMGEQRIFNSADHMSIYPWTVMEAAKSNAHIHAQAVETQQLDLKHDRYLSL